MNLVVALEIAGILYLGLIWAGATMPRVVGMRAHLAALPPFIRHSYWVYYAVVGLMLASFGAITFWFAEELASGAPLARALCAFLATLWTIRLVVALAVFDVRPYTTRPLLRLGHHATTVVFVYLLAVYAWAVLKGGAL